MTLETLINNVLKYNQNLEDIFLIKRAYEYARDLHGNQKRKSGEDYIIHPLAVAIILSELEADASTIVAGLLHDAIEDTKITKEDIAHDFNPYIAMLVDGVTKIGKVNFASKDEEVAANTRKLLSGLEEDIRIILIKLADRLHNMRTIEFLPPEKQKENASETLEVFAPIAYHMGCYRIKSELEDLSFKCLYPDDYNHIETLTKNIELESQEPIGLMLTKIHELLKDNNIPNEVRMRVKNLYRIYIRIKQDSNIRDIHDLLSLRVIVDEVSSCYLSLGLIHSMYHPVQGAVKDYIASPKTNMYKSLHTTIFGEKGYLIRTQIRTTSMERIAALGLTAYWQDENVVMNDELRSKFQFFKPLVEINRSTEDSREFLRVVKKDVLGPNIYIYTSDGEVIALPHGSTVIDYAYKISVETGHNLIAAVVNGELVDPSTELHSKDIVRIITDDLKHGPNPVWAEQCQSPYTKKKINNCPSKGKT